MSSITDEAVERLIDFVEFLEISGPSVGDAVIAPSVCLEHASDLRSLLYTLLSKDREIARLREALTELLEMGELFIPTKLDAPGFNRALQALSTTQDEGGEGGLARADLSSAKRADHDGERLAGQSDLDRAWRAVDACGGAYAPEDEASGYADGHRAALDAACTEIEKLGGRPS